jgi:AcrR family transcriptional regulator
MSNGRVIKNNYHHGNLQNELLEETIKIIAEKNVASVTLRSLSKRLGVSRTAPYRHFSNKTQLLSHVAIIGFERFREHLQTGYERGNGDILEQFQQMGYAYIQFALEHPSYYKLMFNEPLLTENRSAELEAASDASFNQLLDILRQCQQAGVLQHDDIELQAIFIWSSLHGFCSLVLEGHLPLEERQQEDVFLYIKKTLLQGIGVAPTKP